MPASTQSKTSSSTDRLLTAVMLAFMLGMTLALGVYLLWRFNAIPLQLHQPFVAVALLLCPPFILSFVINAKPDFALELVLLVGTIIFANGFLYAGLAAGLYFILDVFKKRRAIR
jgi:hypothetical protein